MRVGVARCSQVSPLLLGLDKPHFGVHCCYCRRWDGCRGYACGALIVVGGPFDVFFFGFLVVFKTPLAFVCALPRMLLRPFVRDALRFECSHYRTAACRWRALSLTRPFRSRRKKAEGSSTGWTALGMWGRRCSTNRPPFR